MAAEASETAALTSVVAALGLPRIQIGDDGPADERRNRPIFELRLCAKTPV